MKDLYVYTGTVDRFAYDPRGGGQADLVLWNTSGDAQAPVRITAQGGLARYLNELQGTDAEERYMDVRWHYDRNLYLDHIEVPNLFGRIPTKLIYNGETFLDDVRIFGQRTFIESGVPEPMSTTQLNAWVAFHWQQGAQTAKESDNDMEP